MVQPQQARSVTQLPRLVALWPTVASRFAMALGGLVLIGWAFDIELLKRVLPGFVAMNPATASLFVLSGAALEILVRHAGYSGLYTAAKVLATLVALGGLCELLEAAGVWHSVIDEILFASKLAQPDVGFANRMAPNTAFAFFLVGIGLLMIDRKGFRSVAQAIAVIVCFTAILPITGYTYGVRSFSGLASFIPMALHTAAAFFVFSGGLFFAMPDAGLTEVFTTNDSRGVLARRLFPAAVLVTLVLGWVRLWGERHNWFDSAFGTALYATSLSVLLAALVRWAVYATGKVEAERAAAQARLHDLSRRKDEMIAVVSHDLCSPLTGFRMVIDLLREKSEPTEDLLDLMDHSARRMVAMVRGLLDVSKLDAERMELERGNVRVSDIINESMQPLAINANAKHITLRLDISPDEPVLYADPLRLAQIFNNLLTNAVKFTAPGGNVTVTVAAEGDGVRVAVNDTGLGIPERELPHIFDKFHQTTTKATAGETGAGLGLAIVRELVLLHNGKIDVASQVGRGTTFTVHLPQGSPRPIAFGAAAEEA